MGSELTEFGLDPVAVAAVRVLVPTGYGLNCEAETRAAFEMLGAQVEQLHVADLFDDPSRLHDCAIVAFIGGFSFGDHVASGRVFANRLRARLGDALAQFVADGGLAIGMCNGFQVMTKLGLLPGPLHADDPVDRLGIQRVSVVGNERLGYRNAWVRMRCDSESPCVWTRGLDWLESPSRHGEGKLVFGEGVREQLEAEHRIPVRYVDEQGSASESWPSNPNGSPGGVAGLCDRSGRVFGLMPHPEAFLYRENHPRWLVGAGGSPRHGQGLSVFANGLRAAYSTPKRRA
jgi:phosphoribosylformylglycinamidine (FGAM) synthase-like amidotransferase family enzyme